jgi:hypothetical protein
VGEQVGEGPLGHQAVLQQVADPGRHPQVVLQHVDRAGGVAHQVAAAHVRPHPELGAHAPALGAEVGRAGQQLGREHAVGHDVLVVVHVVDELVEGRQPLDEAGLDAAPLGGVDDPGDDVEGPGPVDAPAVRVDGEGHAHGQDVQVGVVLAGLELGHAERVDELHQGGGRGPGTAVRTDELVPESRLHPVVGERHAGQCPVTLCHGRRLV